MSWLIGVAHATKHPFPFEIIVDVNWGFMAAGPFLALGLGWWGGRSGKGGLIGLGALLGIVGAALASYKGGDAFLHIIVAALVGGWAGAADRVRARISLIAAWTLVGLALIVMHLSTLGLALVLVWWPLVALPAVVNLVRHRRAARARGPR